MIEPESPSMSCSQIGLHQEPQRLDKWLFHARFIKSRALASSFVAAGKVRLNGERIAKPSRLIRPGDVLTFAQGSQIRVVRVLAAAERRGPAKLAQTLFEDVAD